MIKTLKDGTILVTILKFKLILAFRFWEQYY